MLKFKTAPQLSTSTLSLEYRSCASRKKFSWASVQRAGCRHMGMRIEDQYKVIFALMLLVLQPVLAYGDQGIGSIEVDVKYTNGDRPDYNDMALKIYQDFSPTYYEIIESVSDSPYKIDSLPLGHKYKIEVYINGMYSSVAYANLQSSQERIDMTVPLSGGLRINVFFSDGITPVKGALVSLKSQDGVERSNSVTDEQGSTRRFWTQSTTREGDYYIADIIIGENLTYSQRSITLPPGIKQEVKVVTPWPPVVNELITVHIYKNSTEKITKSDGNFVVVLYDNHENKVAQSNVNGRGEAFFSNLKVGEYVLSAKKIEGSAFNEWGEVKATITGNQQPIEVFKSEPNTIQQEPSMKQVSTDKVTLPSCACVAFRLGGLEDYWLNKVQIGIMEAFQKKNAALTIGIIGKEFGDDQKLVSFVKGRVAKSNPPLEIANNGWEFEDFTSYSKEEQSSLIKEANEKITSLIGVSPAVFIPPYSKLNNDTIIAMKENGITHVSAHRSTDLEPYPLSNSTFYRFPATTSIGYRVNNEGTPEKVTEEQAFLDIQESIRNYGFATVIIYFRDYAVNNGTKFENIVDTQQIQTLESLIDKIRDSGLKIVTIGKINTESATLAIPSWIKNNAGWWSKNKILDSDFISGIQYMIEHKIIVVQNLQNPNHSKEESVPTWIKNNAGWWADGKISDSDFAKGIEFLVKNGMIKV